MFLLLLLLASIGNSHFANSSSPRPIFKQLLNTCCELEYSNSTQCQYFFSTYPWQNDDFITAFRKLTAYNERCPASNILNEKLIQFIENPNFDLPSIGKESFSYAVWSNNTPLAIAIWPHLGKYKNISLDYYYLSLEKLVDLQLDACYILDMYIIPQNMIHLLSRMVSDRPDCLKILEHSMELALNHYTNRAMRDFLVDYGLEITPKHLEYWKVSIDGLEWALLNYPKSKDLIKNSIRNGNEVVAIAVLEFLRQKNYNDQLFQICNETVFDIVKTNKVELLTSIFRHFPNIIFSNGETLMDIAINRGNCTLPMIQLLNLNGLKIAPNHIHKAQSLGYNGNCDPSILDSHLLTLTPRGIYSDIIFDLFEKAVEENKKELVKIANHIISGSGHWKV